MRYELAFIGAGNMAEAIARGILRGNVFRADQMIACDAMSARCDFFARELGIAAVSTAAVAGVDAAIILLCVKPQVMPDVLAELGPRLAPGQLVISIAAGIRIAKIEAALPGVPVIRTMPNTPMLIGHGMIVLSPGTLARDEHMKLAERIFAPASVVRVLAEEHLDAVTALSGSGPAYVFYLAEQMTRAGVALGLPADVAHTLTVQTIVGSALMLKDSPDSPAELRRKVTSPNGTTHAAITHMQAQKMDEIIVDAIAAADRRGKELGG